MSKNFFKNQSFGFGAVCGGKFTPRQIALMPDLGIPKHLGAMWDL